MKQVAANEIQEAALKTIVLHDDDPVAFVRMIEFLYLDDYTRKLRVSNTHWFPEYPHPMRNGEDCLITNLDSFNVYDDATLSAKLYHLGEKYGIERLAKRACEDVRDSLLKKNIWNVDLYWSICDLLGTTAVERNKHLQLALAEVIAEHLNDLQHTLGTRNPFKSVRDFAAEVLRLASQKQRALEVEWHEMIQQKKAKLAKLQQRANQLEANEWSKLWALARGQLEVELSKTDDHGNPITPIDMLKDLAQRKDDLTGWMVEEERMAWDEAGEMMDLTRRRLRFLYDEETCDELISKIEREDDRLKVLA